jgi:ABC-type sugar transport system ATPase subunit
MVYVTHDQVEALVLGDRVAVLRAGELEQVGTPDELWHAPANRFVARFVGSPAMNLVPADGPLRFAALPGGRQLELGVRPDALRLVADGGVAAEVALVEVVGADAFVHLRAGRHHLIARVVAEARPRAGETVHLEVRREDVHLFDAQTGERVAWT